MNLQDELDKLEWRAVKAWDKCGIYLQHRIKEQIYIADKDLMNKTNEERLELIKKQICSNAINVSDVKSGSSFVNNENTT